MSVKVRFQLGYFTAKTIELGGRGLRRVRQTSQFRYVPLKSLNFTLPFPLDLSCSRGHLRQAILQPRQCDRVAFARRER